MVHGLGKFAEVARQRGTNPTTPFTLGQDLSPSEISPDSIGPEYSITNESQSSQEEYS